MIELPICNFNGNIDPIWNTAVRLLGPNDILPIPDRLDNLYLDFETTSEIPNKVSTNPHAESLDETSGNLHKDCKICGVAFLFDEEKYPYYIPVRHAYLDEDENYTYRTHDMPNIAVEKVYDWLKRVMKVAKWWVNQNIKYDVHILTNEVGLIRLPRLQDTMNLAKISSFEEQFEYGLTNIMRLFGIDITPYEQSLLPFKGTKQNPIKDYGLQPPDIMAVYAGVDVLSCRYITHNADIAEECSRIVQMETDLLPELIKMEQVGMKVDAKLLAEDWMKIAGRQRKRTSAIKRVMNFPAFMPEKKISLYELFVERLGWQLDYTEKSLEKLAKGLITEEECTFSFAYESLLKHLRDKPHVAKIWMNYQEEEKLLRSYIIPYLEKFINSDGMIHTNINQILRTGRMSMTAPSMQVLPKRAKEYILPINEDYVLVDFDLSQIEFRVIVHYINNRRAIDQFNRDPTTDFHIWIAEMCKISRQPAKTCNFLCGYGGGKDKLVAELSGLKQIRQELSDEGMIRDRAYEVYKSYHATLPELKPTSYRCGDVLRSRGYVRTLLGRRRYLPRRFHFKSFNSVCQGTAADIQKDITLRLRKFFSIECIPQCLVHDSWLFSIHKSRVNDLIPEMKYEIERPIEGVEFSVPLLSDFGISEKNWKDCG